MEMRLQCHKQSAQTLNRNKLHCNRSRAVSSICCISTLHRMTLVTRSVSKYILALDQSQRQIPVSCSLPASFNKSRQHERGFNSGEIRIDKTKNNKFDPMKCESHMLDFNLYATRDTVSKSVVWRCRWTYARVLAVRDLAYQDKSPRLVQAAICLVEHARHTQAPHRQYWSSSVAPATSDDFALFVDIRVSSEPRTGWQGTGLAATAYVNTCQLSWNLQGVSLANLSSAADDWE